MKHLVDGSPAPLNSTIGPRSRWLVAAAVLSLVYCLALTHQMGEKSHDDAYITYRYAENLARGGGLSFNRGEPYLATTTPLLTLGLAALDRLAPSVPIPVIGQWLSGLALWALCLATYLLLAGDGRPWGGLYVGLLVLCNPWLTSFWGSESRLLLALVTFSFVAYQRNREGACGFLAGLAFLTRGEGALVFVVAMIHHLWRTRRVSWPMAGGCCAVVLPWFLYALQTFGSGLPASLDVKVAQMQSGYFSSFLHGTIVILQKWIGDPMQPGLQIRFAYLLIVLLALLGSRALWRPRAGSFLLLAWVVLYVVGYTLLGAPFYNWYITPIMFGLLVLAGWGAQELFELARQWVRSPYALRSTNLALLLLLLVPIVAGSNDVARNATSTMSLKQEIHTAAGHWLADNTAAHQTVGAFEIGFMGYHSRRDFIDAAGLLNPGVAERIAQGDFKWAYLFYRPDYLVINPSRWYDRLGNIRDEAWFGDAYVEVAQIHVEGYLDTPLTIYEKINDRAIPQPR